MRIGYSYRMPAMVLCSAVLTACGGAEDGGAEDHEFEGYFTGTLNPDGAAAIPAFLYVGQEGDFYIGALPKAVFAGSGDVNGTSYTATGVGRGNGFANGSTSATFSFTGNVSADGGTLTGAYSGGNESGTYTFQWDGAVSSRPASLAAIAGTYHFPATGPQLFSVTIGPSGDFSSFSDRGGCVVSGQIRVLDASWNHYSWHATPSATACSGDPGVMQGHAWMISANEINLFGMQSNLPVFLSAFR